MASVGAGGCAPSSGTSRGTRCARGSGGSGTRRSPRGPSARAPARRRPSRRRCCGTSWPRCWSCRPSSRDTLLGLYFRGLDAPALARETGVPLATLRDRRRRALERLRQRLDRELGGGAWGTVMLRLGGEGGGAAAAVTGTVATLAVAKWALGAAAVALVAFGVRALVRDGGEAPRASEIVTLVGEREESGEPRAAAPRARARPEPPPARPAIAPITAGPTEPEPEALTGSDPALAEVRGRLVLSDGRPATDVEVRVALGGRIQRNGELASLPDPEDWSDAIGTTDADGRFALAFAPPVDFAFELAAGAPGHARVECDLSVLAAGETKEVGELTLFRSATLEGRVVDAGGTPLVGVEWRVSASSIGLGGTNGRSEVRARATCDPRTASFRIEDLAPGPNALEVSTGLADRIRPPRVELEEGALARIDVVYDGADPARRILVSPSVRTFHPQKPAPERVRLLGPGIEPRPATLPEGTSSAYVFDDLAPGAYTVVIDDERFEPWSQGGVVPGTKVRAELTGSAALVLDVVDGTTAERVERYSVRVRTARNTFPNEFVVWDGEAPLPGGLVPGLVPGEIGLVVTAGERTAELALDPLAPGETRHVRVELQRPCRIAGTVRDPSGVPLPGISLLLVRPAEVEDSPASLLTRAGAIGYPVERYRHEIAATRSDDDGGFDFVVSTAGTLLVYADAHGSAVDLGASVTLAPGETREVSTGNEVGRATVACERLDTESVRLVWRLRRSTAAGDAEHGPLVHDHERTVTAELWTDGLRPRSITREARWVWRTETTVVRVLERSSRYELDWLALQPGVAAPEEAHEPPAEVAGWSERCWPELDADELEADARWWRAIWPWLTTARREQLAASVGSAPPGHGRATREGWLRVRSRLERLWLAPDPLAPAELPVRTWVEHAPREAAVDVLLVGDGYAADELAPGARYEQDVERIASGMLAEPPLAWYRDWFNVRVAYLESPRFALETPLRVRQEGRSLIVDDTMRLAQVVRTAGDADIVLVVANRRGCAASATKLFVSLRSGGWRAAPVMSAGCPDLAGTALHEIGHAFAELADEYEDPSGLDLERLRQLQAPNMIAGNRPTARYAPWLHFLALPGAEGLPWMHEGAYYRSEGFWRPWPFCRMRDSSDPFCPVCSEAIARAVFETCGLPFNDELFHEAHPLERWKR